MDTNSNGRFCGIFTKMLIVCQWWLFKHVLVRSNCGIGGSQLLLKISFWKCRIVVRNSVRSLEKWSNFWKFSPKYLFFLLWCSLKRLSLTGNCGLVGPQLLLKISFWKFLYLAKNEFLPDRVKKHWKIQSGRPIFPSKNSKFI
jgi:hypothetical protein